MSTFIFIAALVLAAMLFVLLEICTPSFGLLGLTAAAALVWAAVECFRVAEWVGWCYLVGCLIGVPLYLSLMFKLLPKTPLGKWMAKREPVAPGQGVPESAANTQLIGQKARAITDLHPVGALSLDGRRVIAMAETGFIDSGQMVEIIKVSGGNVVVRLCGDSDVAEES